MTVILNPKKIKAESLKYRYENFGGIIASDTPPFLAHVDRPFMLECGFSHSPLWTNKEQHILSAPLEIHFALTNRCTAGCKTCYMSSEENSTNELSFGDIKKAIDIFAKMGLFHLALGGGESLLRDDIFDIADYIKEKNMVPNLTTNGFLITPKIARKCKVFGQVNISIDGDASSYKKVRGTYGYIRAINALGYLKDAKVRHGINCVVNSYNFDDLSHIISLAKEYKCEDVEFLRVKPVGRGKDIYQSLRLTNNQHKILYPTLKKFARKFKVRVKIDCSFVPMLCYHNPNINIMEKFSVYGCEAGTILLGVNAQGNFGGCSFLKNSESIFNFPKKWYNSNHLSECRSWSKSKHEPCASCDYYSVCKGGCHAVTAYYNSDISTPDPECPFVVESSL